MAALPDNSCRNRNSKLDLNVAISPQSTFKDCKPKSRTSKRKMNNIRSQKQNQNLRLNKREKKNKSEKTKSGIQFKRDQRINKGSERKKVTSRENQQRKKNTKTRVSMKHSKICKEAEKINYSDD